MASVGISPKPDWLSQLSLKIRTLLPDDVNDYCLQVQSFSLFFFNVPGANSTSPLGTSNMVMCEFTGALKVISESIDAKNWCMLCRQTCDHHKAVLGETGVEAHPRHGGHIHDFN